MAEEARAFTQELVDDTPPVDWAIKVLVVTLGASTTSSALAGGALAQTAPSLTPQARLSKLIPVDAAFFRALHRDSFVLAVTALAEFGMVRPYTEVLFQVLPELTDANVVAVGVAALVPECGVTLAQAAERIPRPDWQLPYWIRCLEQAPTATAATRALQQGTKMLPASAHASLLAACARAYGRLEAWGPLRALNDRVLSVRPLDSASVANVVRANAGRPAQLARLLEHIPAAVLEDASVSKAVADARRVPRRLPLDPSRGTEAFQ